MESRGRGDHGAAARSRHRAPAPGGDPGLAGGRRLRLRARRRRLVEWAGFRSASRGRRTRALAFDQRRRLRGGNGLRLPRPLRGARARAAQGRLHRDRLARAPDPARRRTRCREDAAPRRHRSRPRRLPPAADPRLRAVRPPRADGRRHPAREPARVTGARADDGTRRRRRARRGSDRRRPPACRREPDARAARAVVAAASCGRPRQAAAGPDEPDRECGQVLAGWRSRGGRRESRRPACRGCRSGRGPGNRAVRAAPDLREVLSRGPEDDARRERQRPRPLHLAGARPPDGRHDLGRIPARGRLDVRRQAAGPEA